MLLSSSQQLTAVWEAFDAALKQTIQAASDPAYPTAFFDVFGKDRAGQVARAPALEAAAQPPTVRGLSGQVSEVVEKLLEVGIDGRGPFDPARDVGERAFSLGTLQANAFRSNR